MNPIEGGELRLVPLNMVSVQRAGQSGGTDTASTVRGVLLEAHERMMTKEDRALERARESGKDLAAWAADFYARHEPQTRDALMPGAIVVGSLHSLEPESVVGVVDSHVRLICEGAIALALAGGVHNKHRAAVETDRLIGRLIGVSHV
jgi:hypothetical protein